MYTVLGALVESPTSLLESLADTHFEDFTFSGPHVSIHYLWDKGSCPKFGL